MSKYLEFYWSNGIAIGELISTFLLTLLAISAWFFVTNQKNNHSWLMPSLLAGSFIFATIVGWGVGSLITNMGYGLSLMVPGVALFNCLYFWKFNALAMIIGMQILGSLLGFSAFLWIKKFNHWKIVKQVNVLKTRQWQKELFFQALFALLIGSVVPLSQSATAYESGPLLIQLCLFIAIMLLLVLSSRVNFFMISPWLSIMIILAHKQKADWQYLWNSAIHISLFSLLGLGFYLITYWNGRA